MLKELKELLEKIKIRFKNSEYETLINELIVFIQFILKIKTLLNQNNEQEPAGKDEIKEFFIWTSENRETLLSFFEKIKHQQSTVGHDLLFLKTLVLFSRFSFIKDFSVQNIMQFENFLTNFNTFLYIKNLKKERKQILKFMLENILKLLEPIKPEQLEKQGIEKQKFEKLKTTIRLIIQS